MPKQLKKRRQLDQASLKSKFASQQDPDEGWCSDQMVEAADDSTACGSGSIERADSKNLASMIFDSAAMNWIKQAGEFDSCSRYGRPRIIKVDWRAECIKQERRRKLLLWTLNHMDAKQRNEAADNEARQVQRPWRLPRNLDRVDFSRYSLRTRRMMEKLKKLAKVRKAEQVVEPQQLKAKEIAEKKKGAMIAQFLLDLDRFDPMPLPPPVEDAPQYLGSSCRCHQHSRWCQTLGGEESWLLDHFGCGYAKDFFRHFFHQDGEGGQFFKKLILRPMQTKPLVLRSISLEMEIHNYIKKCSEFNARLGKCMKLGDSTASNGFNKVLRILRRKLLNQKFNWIRCKLLHHLHELMPEN